MSLRVWLPLTKDLRQQGLSDVEVTNNGAVFNSAGKLGGTYSSTTSGQTISVNLSNLSTMLANGKTYSLACWVKPTGTPSNGWVIKLGDNSCGLWWAKSVARWVWNENDNGKRCANETISSDYTNWHHLAIVVDKTVSGKITTKQYVDGELANGYPGTTWDSSSHSQPTGTTITISPYVALLNDIRLYDHCLSPMEVKELAKGLVLHYPLNREGWGQENLLSRYVVPGQAAPTSTAAGGRTTWLGDYKITIPATENADTYFRLFTTKQLTANATYTISCQVSGLKDGSYYRFPLYAQSNIGMGVLQLDHNGLCYLTFTMTYGTQTATTGANGETVYICFMDDSARSLASGQGAITVSNFKLEEGSIVTSWCPNSSDVLATTMGLNSTTEYDCSGFGNNGTRTGTFTWSSDTPKYNVSQYFNGSSYILTNSGTFSWFDFNKCTIAVWMKPTTTPSSWAGTFGIAHNNSSSNKSFVIGNYGGKFTVQSANGGWVNIQSSDLPINEWHYCVATLDGTNIKMYFDGELVKTYTTSWGSTTVASDTRVQVGNDLPGSDEIYQGYYSDARIYATALSADDVRALYENSAYIDNSGNTYAATYTEV